MTLSKLVQNFSVKRFSIYGDADAVTNVIIPSTTLQQNPA